MELFCCFAHPDDAELWVGGTIIKHNKLKINTTIVCYDTNELDRNKEAQKASLLLDINKFYLLPRSEQWWRGTDEDLHNLIKLIVEHKPSIVITHPHNDTHPEHKLIANLCIKAAIRAQDILKKRISLYESSTYNGMTIDGIFNPDIFIDITEEWLQKIKVIESYKSQGIDEIVSFIDSQSKFYGTLSNTIRAEGFKRYPLLGLKYDSIKCFNEFNKN